MLNSEFTNEFLPDRARIFNFCVPSTCVTIITIMTMMMMMMIIILIIFSV